VWEPLNASNLTTGELQRPSGIGAALIAPLRPDELHSRRVQGAERVQRGEREADESVGSVEPRYDRVRRLTY